MLINIAHRLYFKLHSAHGEQNMSVKSKSVVLPVRAALVLDVHTWQLCGVVSFV